MTTESSSRLLTRHSIGARASGSTSVKGAAGRPTRRVSAETSFALLDDLVGRWPCCPPPDPPSPPVGGERTKRAALGRDASPVLRAQLVQRRRPIEQRRKIEIGILLEQRHAEPARDAHDHPAAGIGQRQRNRLPSSAKPCTLPVTRSAPAPRAAARSDPEADPPRRPDRTACPAVERTRRPSPVAGPGRADRGDRVPPCGPGPGIAGDGKRGGSRTFGARQIRPKLERVSRVLQRHRLSLQQIELPARIRAEPRIVMVKRPSR